jgi:hypothetical protein
VATTRRRRGSGGGSVWGVCLSADLLFPDRLGRESPREEFWKLPRVRGVLIVDEDGVYWRWLAVDAGEEEERGFLSSHDF